MDLTPRQRFLDEVYQMMGGGIVNVELTPTHYELALNIALETYRQRSTNALEERVAYLELKPNQTEYYLPKEITEVRQIFRRGTSSTTTGSGVEFDPMGAAIANQFIFSGSSSQSNLVTYELLTSYQELVGRMFGLYINFVWHPSRNRLDIVRNVRSNETVLLWVYCHKPDDLLIQDMYSRPWLRRMTLAQAKLILGEARSKFSNIVGPQGGTTLNGDALKAEAQVEIEQLLLELSNQLEQNTGYGFVIG